MEVKVVDGKKGPEVIVVPSHEAGQLIVDIKYGEVALKTAVELITLPRVDKEEISSIRNSNAYVMNQLITPIEDQPGSYLLKTRGRVSIATGMEPYAKSHRIYQFQEVAPVTPNYAQELNRPAVDLSAPENVEKWRKFLCGQISAEEAGPSFYYKDGVPVVVVNPDLFQQLHPERQP